MKSLRRIFPILIALLVTIQVAWVSEIQAQGAPGAPGAGPTMEVEGKIKAVDPSGKMVVLEDGTQLLIPASVNVKREALKEGASLKASFEEKGGQKIVTSIQVQGP